MIFGFVMLLLAGLCPGSFGLGYKKMLPFHGRCSVAYLNIVKSPNREGLDSCFFVCVEWGAKGRRIDRHPSRVNFHNIKGRATLVKILTNVFHP